MKISIANLRKIIHEEVERNMRWMAGFGGSAGINTNSGWNSPVTLDLQDDSEEDEEENVQEE